MKLYELVESTAIDLLLDTFHEEENIGRKDMNESPAYYVVKFIKWLLLKEYIEDLEIKLVK